MMNDECRWQCGSVRFQTQSHSARGNASTRIGDIHISIISIITAAQPHGNMWQVFVMRGVCLLSVALLVISGVYMVRSLVSVRGNVVPIFLSHMRRCSRCWRMLKVTDNEQEAMVQRLVDKWRLERIRDLLHKLLYILSIFQAQALSSAYFDGVLDESARYDASAALNRGKLLPNAFFIAVCLLFAIAPSKATLFRMDTVHALAVIRFIQHIITAETAAIIYQEVSLLATARLVLSACFGNVSLIAFLNFMYCAAVCIAYNRICRGDELVELFMGRDHLLVFVTHRVFECLVIVGISAMFEARSVAEAKVTIQARASMQMESTVTALLSVLCDAVVHLGDTFRLKAPSPQLAALLLRQPLEKGFVGSSILDFVDRCDHDVLMQHLQGCIPGPALSLHVCMVDSRSLRVRTQVYVSCIVDICGRRDYLLGVREVDTEQTDNFKQREDCPPIDCHGENDAAIVRPISMMVHEARERGGNSSRDACSGKVHASGSGSEGSASELNGDTTDENSSGDVSLSVINTDASESAGEVAAWFDAMNPSYPIMRCTTAFSLVGGPSPVGASLFGWLVDGKSFQNIVHEQMNLAFNDDAEPGIIDIGTIKLRPPAARLAGIEYVAQSSLTLPRLDESACDGCSVAVDTVKLVLCGISQRRCRSSKLSRSKSAHGRARGHRQRTGAVQANRATGEAGSSPVGSHKEKL
eukprot:TRINITY_DN63153_c0_g1_i1.p1 TRINITY_DN63153_c0_g1~~TRINITY_DN63153_c0_g1_i1.p1  ORF type:complete len:697 (-),score=79.23 TRINITY_DN63153_c0_g1_i1:59-2149(-)